MNVIDLVNNGKTREIPNPNYNPRAKKNKQPKTITTDKIAYQPNSVVDMVNYDLQHQYSVDKKTIDKYAAHGLTYSPVDDMENQLADAQSNWSKFGNALIQAIGSEIIIGGIKGIFDVADFVGGHILGITDEDYTNPVSEALQEAQNYINEDLAPVYARRHDGLDSTAMGDFGWWMQNLPSVASTLSLLIPSKAIGGAGSLLNKGVKAATKATGISNSGAGLGRVVTKARRWATGVKSGTKLEDMNAFQLWANNPKTILTANAMAKTTGEALIMRTAENYQEAQQVYADMYPQASEKFNDMDDAEFNEWVKNNKDKLDEDVDISDRDAVAKNVAKKAADRTFAMDFSNIVFDVIQLWSLKDLAKGLKKPGGRSVAKAQRESITEAGNIAKTAAGEAVEEAPKISWYKKAGEHASDIIKGSSKAVLAESTEGIEEAVNYIAQEEGLTYGKALLAGNADNYDGGFDAVFETWNKLQNPLNEYLANPKLHESAFWGVLGGLAFGAGGNVLNRTKLALDRKAAEKQRAKNNITGEEINTRDGKGYDVFRYFEMEEDKAAKEAIHKRATLLSQLHDDLELIDKNKDIFSPKDEATGQFREFQGDIKINQAIAKQQVINDYVATLTKDAINTGTYDMLLDYFNSDQVKSAMKKLGIVTDESSDAFEHDIVNTIKNTKEIYDRQSTHIFNQLAAINADRNASEDIPFEYAQIIANKNGDRILAINNIDKQIQAIEVLASQQEDLNNKINPGIDHLRAKNSVYIGSLINHYGKIQAQKRQLENSDIDPLNKEAKLKQLEFQEAAIVKSFSTLETNNFYTTNSLLFSAIKLSQGVTRNEDGTYSDDKTLYTKTDDEIIKEVGNLLNGSVAHEKDNILYNVKLLEKDLQKLTGVEGLYNANKKLFEQYSTLAQLNEMKVAHQSMIASTQQQIKTEVDRLHNSMNEARNTLLVESEKVLRDLYVKYDGINTEHGERIEEAIIEAYKGNRALAVNMAKDFMNSKDAEDFISALDIFNFSSGANDEIFDYIRTIFAKQRQKLKESREKANNEGNNENNVAGDATYDNTESESSTGNFSQNGEQQTSALNNNTQEQQNANSGQINNTQGDTTDNRQTKPISFIFNRKGDIVQIKTTTPGKQPHVQAKVNPDGTLELDIASLSKEDQIKYANKGLFTFGESVNLLNNDREWQITENPTVKKVRNKYEIARQGSINVVSKEEAVAENNENPVEETTNTTEENATSPVEESTNNSETESTDVAVEAEAEEAVVGANIDLFDGASPYNPIKFEEIKEEEVVEEKPVPDYNFTEEQKSSAYWRNSDNFDNRDFRFIANNFDTYKNLYIEYVSGVITKEQFENRVGKYKSAKVIAFMEQAVAAINQKMFEGKPETRFIVEGQLGRTNENKGEGTAHHFGVGSLPDPRLAGRALTRKGAKHEGENVFFRYDNRAYLYIAEAFGDYSIFKGSSRNDWECIFFRVIPTLAQQKRILAYVEKVRNENKLKDWNEFIQHIDDIIQDKDIKQPKKVKETKNEGVTYEQVQHLIGNSIAYGMVKSYQEHGLSRDSVLQRLKRDLNEGTINQDQYDESLLLVDYYYPVNNKEKESTNNAQTKITPQNLHEHIQIVNTNEGMHELFPMQEWSKKVTDVRSIVRDRKSGWYTHNGLTYYVDFSKGGRSGDNISIWFKDSPSPAVRQQIEEWLNQGKRLDEYDTLAKILNEEQPAITLEQNSDTADSSTGEVNITNTLTDDEKYNTVSQKFGEAVGNPLDSSVDLTKIAKDVKDSLIENGVALTESEIDSILTDITNTVIAARAAFDSQTSDLGRSATTLGFMARFEEVEDDTVSPIFANIFNTFMDEYQKIVVCPKVDGKQIVRLEDVLRICNQAYGVADTSIAKGMYNAIVNYLETEEAKAKYTVVDKNKGLSVIENIGKTVDEICKEELDTTSERVNIIDFINTALNNKSYAEREKFFKVFNNLKKGDKVTATVVPNRNGGGKINISKDGVVIGSMAIPKLSGNKLQVIVEGWVTDLGLNKSDIVEGRIVSTIKSLLTGRTLEHDRLRELLTKALITGDNTVLLEEFKNNDLIKQIVEESANEDIYDRRTVYIDDETKQPNYEAMFNHLVKLWKYSSNSTIATNKDDNFININVSLDKWFYDRYNTFYNIYQFSSSNAEAELTIDKISDGDLVKIVGDGESIARYNELTLPTKVIQNLDSAKISIVNPTNDEELIISGKETRVSRKYFGGTTLISIFGNNDAPHLATMIGGKLSDNTITNNPAFNPIAKSIAGSIFDHTMSLINRMHTLKDEENLINFLNSIVRTPNNQQDVIALISPLNGKYTIERFDNGRNYSGIQLVYTDKNGGVQRFKFAINTTNGKFAFQNTFFGTNHNFAEFNNNTQNRELAEKLANSFYIFLLNTGNINISALGIESDNNTSKNINGFISRKDGKIIIDNQNSRIPYHAEYDSYNDFLLKNDLVRINVGVSPTGTNFVSKSENQRSNQYMHVSFPNAAASNNEVSSTETQQTSNNIESTTDESLFNTLQNIAKSQEDTIGLSLFDEALGQDATARFLDIASNYGILDDLLPDTVLYDPKLNVLEGNKWKGSIAYTNSHNKRATYWSHDENGNKKKVRIPANQKFVIGDYLLNMLSSRSLNRRKQGVRKLIHENIHWKLQSDPKNRKEILSRIQEVYDIFERELEAKLKTVDTNSNEYKALSVIKANISSYKGDRLLEEFLVETLTNKNYVDFMNSIQIGEEDNKKEETLFTKIFRVLCDFFGWNIKDGSLLQKELNILRDITTNSEETEQTEQQETVTEAESDIEETFEDNTTTEETTEESTVDSTTPVEETSTENEDEIDTSLFDEEDIDEDDWANEAKYEEINDVLYFDDEKFIRVDDLNSFKNKLSEDSKNKFDELVNNGTIKYLCKL